MIHGRTSVVVSLLVLLSTTSCGQPTEAIDGSAATPTSVTSATSSPPLPRQ
jgi:hypothetical protein